MNIRKSLRMAAVGTAMAAASVTTVVGISSPAAAAGGCAAGHFCAFDNSNYGGMILDSTAGRGTNAVNVADDRTSSGSNRTGNSWVGVTKRTGLPDQTVFSFSAYTDVSYVGSNSNDKIDHFNVR